jgi:uncharacterized protein (TIGR03382 family)
MIHRTVRRILLAGVAALGLGALSPTATALAACEDDGACEVGCGQGGMAADPDCCLDASCACEVDGDCFSEAYCVEQVCVSAECADVACADGYVCESRGDDGLRLCEPEVPVEGGSGCSTSGGGAPVLAGAGIVLVLGLARRRRR